MRTKSDTRKHAILDTATRVFQGAGFERASMTAICERLGYSKATLYNYFPSKEGLFVAVLLEATEAECQATHEALNPTLEDLCQALELFGQRLLTLIYSPEVQAIRRLVASEAGRSHLGKHCYERGALRSQEDLADFLQRAMDAGKLPQADTRIAALHLLGLLESEWSAPLMFQTQEAVSDEEIKETVGRAVATFMRAYGPPRG